ncbi:MAG: hypothetical protein Q9221_004139 [Calogaya cf. arnoldii]
MAHTAPKSPSDTIRRQNPTLPIPTSSTTSSLKPSTSSSTSRLASPPPTSSLKSLLHSLLPTTRSHRRQKQNYQHATLLAHTYLSSCPLPQHLPAQRDIYSFCRHLLQNDPISPGSITHYIPILKHRLNGLSTATRYRNLLNLNSDFPDCYGFDFGKWRDDHEISSPTTKSIKNELGKNKRDSGYGNNDPTSSSTKPSSTTNSNTPSPSSSHPSSSIPHPGFRHLKNNNNKAQKIQNPITNSPLLWRRLGGAVRR